MAATKTPGEGYMCIDIPTTNNHGNENQSEVEFRPQSEIEKETLMPSQNLKTDTSEKQLVSNSNPQPQDNSTEYSLTNKYIGTAIIINNLDEEQQSTRADVAILSDLLKETGFQTSVYLNLTKPEMDELRRNVIRKEETHENSSSFALIVIAHGKEDNDKSTGVVRKVMDVTGRVVWDMNVVEQQLNEVSTLKGKPKLVIVEACRGRKKNKRKAPNIEIMDKGSTSPCVHAEVESDDEYIQEKNKGGSGAQYFSQMSAVSADYTPCSQHADMKDQLICLATVRNYVAHTLKKSGSVYIQQLVKPWKEFMYLEPLTEIHRHASNNITKEPIEGQVYQVPEMRTTLALQLNFRNYLIQNEDPQKGHVYWKTNTSILGRGYDQLNQQLKHYNVFETFPNESRYRLPNQDFVEVKNEFTEKSLLHIPECTDDTMTITFHKEFRIAHISFKESVREKLDSLCENSNYFCSICSESSEPLTFDSLESAKNHMEEAHNNKMHPTSGANFHFSEDFKEALKLSKKNGKLSNDLEQKNITDFLDFFGNNFIISHFMGGSVTATILVNAKSRLLTKMNIEDLKTNLDNIFSGKEEKDQMLNAHCKVVKIDFQGGIITDMTNKFEDISQADILTWTKSIEDNPISLTMEMTLAPIYLAVAKIDSQKGDQIKEVVEMESPHEKHEKCFSYLNNKNKDKVGGNIILDNPNICGDKLIKYVGYTENNQRHGDGEGYFRNGDVYIGQWREGKPEGLGTWYYKGGKEMKGIFKKEKVITKLSGNPKKKDYQRKSFWLRTLPNIFLLSVMIGILGWRLHCGLQKTCTERLKEEWHKVYHLNVTGSRAFMELNMNNLSSPILNYCMGTTVYVDDFPFEKNANWLTKDIPTEDSNIYKFQFPTNMTVQKYCPHGDKMFRLRSCWRGKDCKTNLKHSKGFSYKRHQTLPKTCTERIKEEWQNVYHLKRWENTTPTQRAFFKFNMNKLSQDTDKCYCKGKTVFIDDLPFEPNLNCSTTAIPTDISKIYQFQFPKNMTAEKLRPQGNKIFRIRSCLKGKDCKTKLEHSANFICYNGSETNLRNLTCPETIIENWKNVSEYNSENATLKVDLTKLPNSCHTQDNPIYMQVISIGKDFDYKWEGCEEIAGRQHVMPFSEVFEFNQSASIKEIGFFSGHFIIRFKQGNNTCKKDLKACESFDCTSRLIHHQWDQEEKDIFDLWKNTTRNTNKINFKWKNNTKLKINPVTKGNCSLQLERIPLYQVFLNISYFTAQLTLNEMPKDEKATCQEGIESQKVRVLSTKNKTYVNEPQIYTINENSSYCLTLRPNYAFCGVKDEYPKCECFYQAIIDCSDCNCKVSNSSFQHGCSIITHSDFKRFDPNSFPGYIDNRKTNPN